MYKMVYRQQGGLSSLGSEAFMRQEVDKRLAKFKQRSRNVGQQARSRPNFIQRNIEPYKNKLYDRLANLAGDEERVQTMSDLRLENSELKNPVYFPGESGTGLMSDLRHKSASNKLSQALTPNIPGGEIIGDTLSFVGGGLRELKNMLPPILTGRTEQENLENWRATKEDLKANYEGTFGTDNKTTTTEDIYREGLNLPKQVQTTVNPLDYQDELNFRRHYLSDYIDPSEDKFGEENKLSSYAYIPEVSPLYNATQETGRSFDPQRYSEYQKARAAADRAWRYRNNPEQASAFQPVATPISMQNEQQATGFQKVNDINNAFQKVNNEVLKPVQNQPQGLPNLMKIVNEQRNPTPVVPSNATGFKTKEDAMEDLRLKYPRAGLVAMPHQNADGSWSYQPPNEPMSTHYPGMAI